jgi:hypothetical protein
MYVNTNISEEKGDSVFKTESDIRIQKNKIWICRAKETQNVIKETVTTELYQLKQFMK